MQPTDPERLDIFEFDPAAHHGAPTADRASFDDDPGDSRPDEVSAGGSQLNLPLARQRADTAARWRMRWRALPRLEQGLVALSAVALVVAGFCSIAGVRADPTVRRTTRTTVIAAPSIAIDALGCPRDRSCTLRISPTDVVAAAHEALPSAVVTYAAQEFDEQTGEVYQTRLRMTAVHTTIQVTSQCVPGAAAVQTEPLEVLRVTGSVSESASPDEPTPPGLKYWAITLASSLPGGIGCGVSVTAESTLTQGIAGEQIDTVVNQLADDERLMASR